MCEYVLIAALITNTGYWKHVKPLAGHQQPSQPWWWNFLCNGRGGPRHRVHQGQHRDIIYSTTVICHSFEKIYSAFVKKNLRKRRNSSLSLSVFWDQRDVGECIIVLTSGQLYPSPLVSADAAQRWKRHTVSQGRGEGFLLPGCLLRMFFILFSLWGVVHFLHTVQNRSRAFTVGY